MHEPNVFILANGANSDEIAASNLGGWSGVGDLSYWAYLMTCLRDSKTYVLNLFLKKEHLPDGKA